MVLLGAVGIAPVAADSQAPAGAEVYSGSRAAAAVTGGPVARASAEAYAADLYQLRVDGGRDAQGPAYAYPDEQYYETTDVTSAIKAGTSNALAFVTFWGQ